MDTQQYEMAFEGERKMDQEEFFFVQIASLIVTVAK